MAGALATAPEPGQDTTLEPGSPVMRELSARARDPEHLARFQGQLKSSGYCARPVRLRGHVEACAGHGGPGRVIWSTDREPDGVLRKACGNRREAVCPTCAERYRGDAYQIVVSGLRGGKGVSESVAENPAVFVTLTAPSFGPVHTCHSDGRRHCRPRRDAELCSHGRRLSCGEIHDPDDPGVGEPICPDCFDYDAAVLWNNRLGELWRRTTIYVPRALARLRGITQKALKQDVRVSYVRVGEYQRRGLLHLHVVMRLDKAQPAYRAHEIRPPAPVYSVELLADAVRAAVTDVSCPIADGVEGAIRWGTELRVDPIHPGEAKVRAGYLAKYATKSTELAGGVHHHADPQDPATLPAREHSRRLVTRALELGARRELRDLRLPRYAQAFGARSHCLTKSRRYSTTFGELRAARERHVHEQLLKRPTDAAQRAIAEHADQRRSHFVFVGVGHITAADALLARWGAAKARQQREAAREDASIRRQRSHDNPAEAA
jgi:hypothetical protein